jgi:hypothetical protein
MVVLEGIALEAYKCLDDSGNILDGLGRVKCLNCKYSREQVYIFINSEPSFLVGNWIFEF